MGITHNDALMERIKEQAETIHKQALRISELMTQRDALLAACKFAVSVIGMLADQDEGYAIGAQEAICAAIARAEGKQP